MLPDVVRAPLHSKVPSQSPTSPPMRSNNRCPALDAGVAGEGVCAADGTDASNASATTQEAGSDTDERAPLDMTFLRGRTDWITFPAAREFLGAPAAVER